LPHSKKLPFSRGCAPFGRTASLARSPAKLPSKKPSASSPRIWSSSAGVAPISPINGQKSACARRQKRRRQGRGNVPFPISNQRFWFSEFWCVEGCSDDLGCCIGCLLRESITRGPSENQYVFNDNRSDVILNPTRC